MKSACEGEDETGDGVNEMVIEYETDEEEFENSGNHGILLGGSRLDTTPAVPAQVQVTDKCKNTAKRDVSAVPRGKKRKVPTKEYNLGCLTLWWNRMVREGLKERLGRERMARDKRKFQEMLKMSKERSGNLVLTPDRNSDLTENDVTTAWSCENDVMIHGWPLTQSSPSNND